MLCTALSNQNDLSDSISEESSQSPAEIANGCLFKFSHFKASLEIHVRIHMFY